MADNLGRITRLQPGLSDIDVRAALERSLIDDARPLAAATMEDEARVPRRKRAEVSLDPKLVDEIDRTRWPRLNWADRTLILVLIGTVLGGYAWAFGVFG